VTQDTRTFTLPLLPPPLVPYLSFCILYNVQHSAQHANRNSDPHLFVPLNTLLGSDTRKDRIGVPAENGARNVLKFLWCGVTSSFGLVEGLSSCGIFQELRVDSISGYLNVTDYRATDKAVFHRNHVGVPGLIRHLDIVQSDIQKLVHRFEHTGNQEVVLEFHDDGLVCESFEDR